MTPAPRPAPRFTQRLGVRLGLLMSLALLPVGLLAVLQSTDVLREARARAEAALMGETLQAARSEVRAIQSARATAENLAVTLPPLLDDPERCSAVLRALKDASELYSFLAFTMPGGRATCTSTGEPVDFASSPLVARAEADPRPRLGVNPHGPVSNASILYASQPVFGSGGALLGLVWVSIPHSAIKSIDNERTARGLQISTFGRDGEILTSTDGIEAGQSAIPQDRALAAFVGGPPTAFSAYSVAGDARVFSVVPLIEGELYALGSEPVRGAALATPGAAVPPYVLPALMWLVSLAVAWVATERLVSRPIRRLRDSITSFAGGSRIVGDIDFARAPVEIREAAEAYERMTDTILHDEAELEDTIHQKEVLLREVHHRVKNNLQLIASILNMQIRQARTPEARAMMKTLQDRVLSLATIHRGLYQTSGLTDVRADELLPDIVRQVLSFGTGPGRRFEVETAFDDLRLTPDQAVPLSLLMTELLTNALKYGGPGTDGRARLELSLRRSGGTAALLTVRNSVPADPGEARGSATESTGLGAQLAEAFAQQLGGHLEVDQNDGAFAASLRFELTPLDTAEERNLTRPPLTPLP
jgi:two-component sensor histidine kinase